MNAYVWGRIITAPATDSMPGKAGKVQRGESARLSASRLLERSAWRFSITKLRNFSPKGDSGEGTEAKDEPGKVERPGETGAGMML